jgi:hypothetical protein
MIWAIGLVIEKIGLKLVLRIVKKGAPMKSYFYTLRGNLGFVKDFSIFGVDCTTRYDRAKKLDILGAKSALQFIEQHKDDRGFEYCNDLKIIKVHVEYSEEEYNESQ